MSNLGLKSIDGNRLRLRLVRPDDAEYIHSLRIDDRYNAHLSAVSGTFEDQRAWIENYKLRETAGTEYYYIIEVRAENCSCGVVRLYGFDGDYFTWGSWILAENKPKLAALESAFLVYRIGFEMLGCSHSTFDVRNMNDRTLAFHRRFGASEIGEDDMNIYFKYTADRFFADRENFLHTLNLKDQL